ncbi:MAG: hypothetical protein GY855_05855 [candidate division Zixibacteria bacterium]|nr:hypothetical protein [candidate division Zixibacteria bacterium]
MKRIFSMFTRMMVPGVKTRCPFCGAEIRVEFALSICPHCLGTIRYKSEPTSKISRKDIFNKES